MTLPRRDPIPRPQGLRAWFRYEDRVATKAAIQGEKFAGDAPPGFVPKPYVPPPPITGVHALFANWLEQRQNEGKSLPYPLYAVARWGVLEGLRRTWEFHLHPRKAVQWARDRYRAWKLVDRRPRTKYYSSPASYAINRDGDFYLVECPLCHDTQSIYYNRDKDQVLNSSLARIPRGTFECYRCHVGIRIWIEDGVIRLRDHREGVPPLPTKAVYDDQGNLHLGITADAPWWWKRVEIERDLVNGWDAHHHKPYATFSVEQIQLGNAQAEASQ